MTPNSHNLLYIVSDTTAYKASHITMMGPEQFIHWIKTEIIHYNKGDGLIIDLADLLIGYLNRQIAGEATHQLVISVAKELDLRVTVIAGTVIADCSGEPYGPYMPKKVRARLIAMRNREFAKEAKEAKEGNNE